MRPLSAACGGRVVVAAVRRSGGEDRGCRSSISSQAFGGRRLGGESGGGETTDHLLDSYKEIFARHNRASFFTKYQRDFR